MEEGPVQKVEAGPNRLRLGTCLKTETTLELQSQIEEGSWQKSFSG